MLFWVVRARSWLAQQTLEDIGTRDADMVLKPVHTEVYL